MICLTCLGKVSAIRAGTLPAHYENYLPLADGWVLMSSPEFIIHYRSEIARILTIPVFLESNQLWFIIYYRSEVARILMTSYPLVFNMTLYCYGNRLLDVLMVVTYALTTDNFRTSTFFVVLSFCTVLRQVFMRRFPQAIQLIHECRVAMARIEVIYVTFVKNNPIFFNFFVWPIRLEIAKIIRSTYPLSFNMTMKVFGNRLIDVFMIVTYTLTASEIRASTIFVVISFCTTIRYSFLNFLPSAAMLLSECLVSSKRIEVGWWHSQENLAFAYQAAYDRGP